MSRSTIHHGRKGVPVTPPRTPVKASHKTSRAPKARVYSNVDDVSWHSIAKDVWFPGYGDDYSSTFSPDPLEQTCTPILRMLRHRGPKEYDVSPPSFVQPGPPLVLKQDDRARLRERFQARCDSPTPSEDTLVRLNRQDSTPSPSLACHASLSSTPEPDTTRSTPPSVRPKLSVPPPMTPPDRTGRSTLPPSVRPPNPSPPPTVTPESTAWSIPRPSKNPAAPPKVTPDRTAWRIPPSDVRRKSSSHPPGTGPEPTPRSARVARPKRQPPPAKEKLEVWGPGAPYIADFLSNERVLTRGGLRYHNRIPEEWYKPT